MLNEKKFGIVLSLILFVSVFSFGVVSASTEDTAKGNLTGKVGIVLLFTKSPGTHSWTQAEKNHAKAQVAWSIEVLEYEAPDEANLEMSLIPISDTYDTNTDPNYLGECDSSNTRMRMDSIIRAAGYPNITEFNNYVMDEWRVDNVVLIFMTKPAPLIFGEWKSSTCLNPPRIMLNYFGGSVSWIPSAVPGHIYLHEILHGFGAFDEYGGGAGCKSANACGINPGCYYCSGHKNSIMVASPKIEYGWTAWISDGTRNQIGWTDEDDDSVIGAYDACPKTAGDFYKGCPDLGCSICEYPVYGERPRCAYLPTTTMCNPEFRCTSGTGEDTYDSQGSFSCQGFCNNVGNCVASRNCVSTDFDNDGYNLECDNDCDDNDPGVWPGVPDNNCDGIDNNCNGWIDDDYENGDSICGVGACRNYGYKECTLEGEISFCTPLLPSDEICDGLDNDCDGLVDEGAKCGSHFSICGDGICGLMENPISCPEDCSVSVSVCGDEICGFGEDGISCPEDCPIPVCGDDICDPGELVITCGNGILEPGEECDDGNTVDGDGCSATCELECIAEPEVCDGIDNNCDGLVDEGLTQSTGELGACSINTETCNAGSYASNNQYVSQVEVCDGIDNDCDEEADEELGATTCGLGACQKTVDNCVGGINQVCNPMEGAALEVCDGIDNDCDGLIDEDLTQSTGESGACSINTETCVAGTYILNNEYTALAETCDNVDNNCDGQIDEDLTQSTNELGSCSINTETCTAGIYIPNNNYIPQAETCDDLDNDCNNIIDDADEDNDGFMDCFGEDKCLGTVGEQIANGCSSEQIIGLKPGESTMKNKKSDPKGLMGVFAKAIGWARNLF